MIPRRCVISGSHVDAQGTITPAGGAAHMLREDLFQPWPDRGCHGVKISLQAVVARHLHYPAMLALGRHAKWVSFPLDDQSGNVHRSEFVQAARSAGAARGVQWEREAEHRDRADRLGGAACDPRP